jgi:hypothetical protein
MTRRRFAFWLGFGLFSLGDKLRLGGLDSLAAAAMEGVAPQSKKPALPEHWTATGDDTWQWFERENYIDGQWMLTGTTRPVHKETGELKPENEAYLADELLPAEMRPAESNADESNAAELNRAEASRAEASRAEASRGEVPKEVESASAEAAATVTSDENKDDDKDEDDQRRWQLPASTRRARHGRPPSKWLRSLNADEIRIWLKTVKVPEAGVSGMTYWEHLTRDHAFDPKLIEGLEITEQAKLHAAAHFGY